MIKGHPHKSSRVYTLISQRAQTERSPQGGARSTVSKFKERKVLAEQAIRQSQLKNF